VSPVDFPDGHSEIFLTSFEVPETPLPDELFATTVPDAPGFADPTAGTPTVRGYEILSTIGHGGMGIVYKARHRDLHRVVALKMLRGNALDDAEFRERFRSEAEAVARLQHPHIIQVFEIGTVEPQLGDLYPRPFIALEYVEGGSLADQVGKPHTPDFAARMVEKLARAVEAAHRVGVIHRDLKPANVLLTTDGEPKIADFGLAKHVGARDVTGRFQTQAGVLLGTPEYMAPEQATGDLSTPASDIYALGVILYELLTGRVPFDAVTPVQTLALARGVEAVPPRRLNPSVPRDLETICLKCLEKEPRRRYASAEALADDLQCFLADRPIQARRMGDLERIWRWGRRNPVMASLIAAVSGLFLTIFVLVLSGYRRSEQARIELAAQRDAARQREKSERWERYRANIAAANNALQVHNVSSARDTLDAAPLDLRNWEWRHFHAQLDLASSVENIGVAHLAEGSVTENGRRLLLYGLDPWVRVWDVVDRREVRAFRLPSVEDRGVVSPDGRLCAYNTNEHTIVVLELDAGRQRAVLRQPEQALQPIGFDGAGSILATGVADGTVQLWDSGTGNLRRSVAVRSGKTGCRSLSADGRRLTLAAKGNETITIWDVDNDRALCALPGHTHPAPTALFAPGGQRLATIEGYPSNTVRLWEVATGRLLGTLSGHSNQIDAITFSPDGTRLATGSRDQTIGLWDGRTGQSIAMLRGHVGWITQVCFCPDSKRLVSASRDHTLRIWEANTGVPAAVLVGHLGDVLTATWTEEGIASASTDGSVRFWDARAVETRGILTGHSTFIYGVAFHPDGERLVSASWDGTARLWEATTGRELTRFAHAEGEIVSSVAIHPAGQWMVTRGRQSIRLWDIASGEELERWEVPNGGWRDTRIAFTRKGDRFAAGCAQQEIRIWDVASRQEVATLRGHRDEIRDVAFSPDGRWLASVADLSDLAVRIWDVARGTEAYVLHGPTAGGYAVAFNDQGTLLAASSTDGTVRLWTTANWREVATLKHRSPVYTVAFTPDGSRLACGCSDNSIRFWDVASGAEVADLRGHTNYVHQLAFSPDGSRLVSASGDKTLRIWDTMRPQDRDQRGR
jgi:WD40 repeat protein/tRNA A-37 threonylcarbamoyl transferase component Bud32